MNVELHIDRLVLEGIDLPRGQRDLLRECVRSELDRLLRDAGPAAVPPGGAVDMVRAPSVELSAGADLAEIGRQVAGAIYGGLGT